MRMTRTPLKDLSQIEPDVFGDARGKFVELFRQTRYEALGITGPVLAFAVELVRRLLDYVSAGRPRPFAMRIQAVLEPDIDRLRVLARDRRGAGDIVSPFGIDDYVAVTKPHLGMDELSLGVADHHAALEAESGFQPRQRCKRIPVEDT